MHSEDSGTTRDLYSISGSGPSDVIAVSTFGVSIHSTGDGTWTAYTHTNVPESFFSVWSAAPGLAYAGTQVCGRGCTAPIYRTTDGGADWTEVAMVASVVWDIWGTGPGNIWFIYNEVGPTPNLEQTSDGFATFTDTNLPYPTLTEPVRVIGAGGSRLVVLVSNGQIFTSDDAGTTWSGPFFTPVAHGLFTETWDGRTLWFGGMDGLQRSSDLRTATPVPGGGTGITAVWAGGPDDVWVAGDAGILHSTDGATFAPVDPQTGIRDAWGSGPGDVYFVGNGGVVKHWH